jgi:hypothetical protein
MCAPAVEVFEHGRLSDLCWPLSRNMQGALFVRGKIRKCELANEGFSGGFRPRWLESIETGSSVRAVGMVESQGSANVPRSLKRRVWRSPCWMRQVADG